MANVLKDEKKQQIIALGRLGWSLRKIEETTRVRRETISAYLRSAGVEIWPRGRWKREGKAKPAIQVITDFVRDNVSGAKDVLPRIRSSGSNQRSVVFVIVNHTAEIDTLLKGGANFVLAKPVQDTALRGFLDIAIGRMEREHRRYFRHKVDMPIRLFFNTGESFAGKVKNVSEGGLALAPCGPITVQGGVTLQFELPSAEPQAFKAKAEVVWSDA